LLTPLSHRPKHTHTHTRSPTHARTPRPPSGQPGGDLCLINLPGYGVDAFLTLRRLDTSGWREQLDGDEAAEGGQVAVSAALSLQQELQRSRK
jgi:hypothetical protein